MASVICYQEVSEWLLARWLALKREREFNILKGVGKKYLMNMNDVHVPLFTDCYSKHSFLEVGCTYKWRGNKEGLKN